MRKENLIVFSLVLVGVLVFTSTSYASSGDLPYETALEGFRDSLTGPVGTAIGVIALFVSGFMFVFGADLGGLAKSLIGVCFAIGIMLSGNKVISTWFKGGSGSLITQVEVLSEKSLSDKLFSEFKKYYE